MLITDTENTPARDEPSGRMEQLFSVASRVFVWVLLLGIIYLLRSFFLLLFLTFVFSYVQAHGVQLLTPRLKNRALAVVLVGLAFLGVVIAIGSFLAPRVVAQAALFAEKYPSYVRTIDLELSQLSRSYPLVFGFLPSTSQAPEARPESWNLSTSTTATILQQLLGFHEGEADTNLNRAVNLLRNFGQYVLGLISAFLLALLFSFLIVLDLPRLTRSVTELSRTKLGFIYEEVGENIKDFGLILGHSLEAQLLIALLNTVLTAIMVQFLGLGGKLAFLSIIVFLCSFIPVAGVFISSVPICLMTLQERGVSMMFFAILGIWIIHMIEAYVLNPRIFGTRLHINPVLVLVILTLAGKLFHVWGLVLGVPVCSYFFGHAIRYRSRMEEQLSAAAPSP